MGHYCYDHLNLGVEQHLQQGKCTVIRFTYQGADKCLAPGCGNQAAYQTIAEDRKE